MRFRDRDRVLDDPRKGEEEEEEEEERRRFAVVGEWKELSEGEERGVTCCEFSKAGRLTMQDCSGSNLTKHRMYNEKKDST